MAPQKKKLDRRIRRTRKLLGEALIELVTERGYESLTIHDIAERADVARTTFYTHYRDKDDLLFQTVRDILDEQVENLPKSLWTNEEGSDILMPDPTTSLDFEHIAEYADFYRAILGEHGSPKFIFLIRNYLVEVIKQVLLEGMELKPRYPLDFVLHLAAGANIGIYMWWLENDMPVGVEEISEMTYQALSRGFWWALGVPPITNPQDSGNATGAQGKNQKSDSS